MNRQAETSFWRGMQLLEAGRPRDAAVFFKSAIELAAGDELDRAQARYLSYYGLSLCLSRSDFREALSNCRMATRLEVDLPELWRNLGRVAITLGRRAEAYRSWQRGLALEPDHPGIREDLEKLGTRAKPALSFLSRSHPLNVALGRFRAICLSTRATERSRKRSATGGVALLEPPTHDGPAPPLRKIG